MEFCGSAGHDSQLLLAIAIFDYCKPVTACLFFVLNRVLAIYTEEVEEQIIFRFFKIFRVEVKYDIGL
jgi:hypothetical protein